MPTSTCSRPPTSPCPAGAAWRASSAGNGSSSSTPPPVTSTVATGSGCAAAGGRTSCRSSCSPRWPPGSECSTTPAGPTPRAKHGCCCSSRPSGRRCAAARRPSSPMATGDGSNSTSASCGAAGGPTSAVLIGEWMRRRQAWGAGTGSLRGQLPWLSASAQRTGSSRSTTSYGPSPRQHAMNKYGARLMRQWQTADPERFAQIPDPEEFFTQMGADLEERIDALARATAGPDRPGEDYLEKVARLTSARVNAESDLIREAMIPAPGEEIEEPLPPEWRSIWTHHPEYETNPD